MPGSASGSDFFLEDDFLELPGFLGSCDADFSSVSGLKGCSCP